MNSCFSSSLPPTLTAQPHTPPGTAHGSCVMFSVAGVRAPLYGTTDGRARGRPVRSPSDTRSKKNANRQGTAASMNSETKRFTTV